ncbi:MAG: F0F1 ATP synthase subunit delta [Candidatus Omnitrophica bacterium]|nr:F0F1 ATP synthase subunit delta [Candidatus Omnitrophota bacterium]
MALDPIASRYAQALFETAKAQGQVDPTHEQLALLGRLMSQEPELQAFLINPDVEPQQKLEVLDRALQGSWSELVRSFLLLVLSFGRSESLLAIIEAFQAAVDEDAGRLRVVVRSASGLPHALLERIKKDVERRERKTVELATEVDPSLIGGVQLRLDHRVIDGSVRRQLDDLRQQLKTVKVH